MAIGNPLLAVWDVDSVLRTYEYAGGAFVPLASVGGMVHTPASAALTAGADPAPYLKWDWDDAYLLIIRCTTTGNMASQTFSPILAPVQGLTGVLNASAGGKCDSIEQGHFHLVLYSNFPRLTQLKMDAAGQMSLQQTLEGTVAYQGASSFVAGKDGENLFASYDASKAQAYRKWYRYTAIEAPLYSPGTAPDINTIFSTLIATSYNGTSLITVGTGGAAKVWSYPNADNVGPTNFLQELSVPAGVPQRIAMSRDNVFMAISALDAGVHTTFVYKRVGEYFTQVQTLTGIGRLLEFSYDGVLLIDAGLKQCYIFNGVQFVANHTAMASLPTLVQAQAVSKGRVNPNGYSYLYGGAVEALANNSVNLADLKLDLLTDAASFNEAHTSISNVTNAGAYRTTTGAWPVGGKALTGVDRIPGNGTLTLDADSISHIVINSNLVARYAVIYEVSTGKPLIWIDLNTVRVIAHGRELTINFRGGELLKFSK